MFQANDDVLSLWNKMLSDIPAERATRNLQQHIKTMKFPPTIAEIRGSEGASMINNMRLETQQLLQQIKQWEENACPRLSAGVKQNA
ncbi:Loader and inhibitor of phage G40P [compost metagenome]